MAHFAKFNKNNVVIFVTVWRQEDDGKEYMWDEPTVSWKEFKQE